MNLLDTLYGASQASRVAFRSDTGTDWTVGASLAAIGRYAAWLRDHGVGEGDRVSVKLPKSLDALLLVHACFQIGAAVHPLNPSYTLIETLGLIEDVQARLVICSAAEFADLQTRVLCAIAHFDDLGDATGVATEARAMPDLVGRVDVDGAHTAAILYTSGSTGRPKGAQISHSNLSSSARALAALWNIVPGDRLLHFLPTSHAHGLLTSVHVMLTGGACIDFTPAFTVPDVLQRLPQTTVLMGVPTHYGRLLGEPTLRAACARLRLAICGSAPLPPEIARGFFAQTGVPITQRYGSTEAAIITAMPAGHDDRMDWVGWALEDVNIRARLPDGTTASHGAIGTLEVSGPNVFTGYLGRPDAQAESFTPDGWFRTGDIAEIDEEGCVRILGRAKELIISGGMNVYPPEIEAAVSALAGVAEVAVIGVPHPDFGEVGVAIVRAADGRVLDEAQCIARLKEQLAPYKVPKRFIQVDALPLTAAGKVDKRSLVRDHDALFVAQSVTGAP